MYSLENMQAVPIENVVVDMINNNNNQQNLSKLSLITQHMIQNSKNLHEVQNGTKMSNFVDPNQQQLTSKRSMFVNEPAEAFNNVIHSKACSQINLQIQSNLNSCPISNYGDLKRVMNEPEEAVSTLINSKACSQINHQIQSNLNSKQNFGSKHRFLPAQQIQSKNSVCQMVNEDPCPIASTGDLQGVMSKISVHNCNATKEIKIMTKNQSKMSHFSNQNLVELKFP